MKIKVDDLAKTIQKELEQYHRLTNEQLKETVREVGKETKEVVKENAPVKSGDYRKSWAVKVVNESADSLHLVVHSKDSYQLTHLLEFGHAKRNGGRTKAIPHIGDAEQKAVQSFEKKVKEILSND
ncbi:TPA: HK97 gp10 family phage protein [Streptococcus suis]|nr:HK97 gp10 family phage protein [Streptococcus suis]HEM4926398.1 HK97 gp10 family phage protein [Streptococcus suis]